MAATQGGTQSLHTNALDEALALPTDFSARIARNTQLFLQHEVRHHADHRSVGRLVLCRAPDRTTSPARALAHIAEVEALGGMAKAIEAGMPKLRIEEAAARTQARIDSGQQTVVGVNRYPARPTSRRSRCCKVDNSAVRAAQIEKLAAAARPSATRRRCQAALDALTAARASGSGNLLALAVEAARAKATVGEISRGAREGLRPVPRRRPSHRRRLRGEIGAQTMAIVARVAAAGRGVRARSDGRPPRILVAKIGQDGHDRGQKVIASAFADLGFDVDIGPLFQTPEEAAALAIENDVHIVGVSSLAAGTSRSFRR